MSVPSLQGTVQAQVNNVDVIPALTDQGKFLAADIFSNILLFNYVYDLMFS